MSAQIRLVADAVRRIITLIGSDQLMPVYQTLAAALADPSASLSAVVRGSGFIAELRKYLAPIELEEALLLGTDLGDVDLVEVGFHEGAEAGQVSCRVRAARRGNLIRPDQVRDLLEVARQREKLGSFSWDRVCPPEPVHGLAS